MNKFKDWQVVKNLAYNGMDNLKTIDYQMYLRCIDTVEMKLIELEQLREERKRLIEKGMKLTLDNELLKRELEQLKEELEK